MKISRRTLLASAAALSPVRAADPRPNILFFFPDQWRFDWTGWNKSLPLKTPNLNALRARGVSFSNCLVASPLCAPSRACLASGREYTRAGVKNNGFNYPLEQETFYQRLRDSGYHVTACGKIDLHKKTLNWGVDGKRLTREWGFSDAIDNAGKGDAISSVRSDGVPKDPYMTYLKSRDLMETHVADFRSRAGHEGHYANTKPTPLPDEAYCDNWIAANGLKLLRGAPAAQPWFLVLNFTGPHSPMDITRTMEPACRGRQYPAPFECKEFDAPTHQAIRQNYGAMIENIDRWLGVFVDELRRRGELDRTLIVFSSDHGEMLGDHNRWGKTLPYHASVGVPLVIAGPGVKKQPDSKALVSHIDLAATFLDYAQAKPLADADSRTLRPVLKGQAQAHRDFVRSGLNDWRLAFDGRYKLVRGYEGEDRLYDLAADPNESRNLAAAQPDRVKKMEAWL